jgi:molybdopterin/thiamine biosynthesis adenylyltransferase
MTKRALGSRAILRRSMGTRGVEHGSIVVIGAGGIGAPLVWALAEAGAQRLTLVDEDVVELGNLHRQVLFRDEDVGRSKVVALAEALGREHPAVEVTWIEGRALPETAERILGGAGVVIDATDNFPTRFLLADAAQLVGVPIVHAAAVRWQATVLAVAPGGRPCYRCLFEDVPSGVVIDCATAGVAGPVCGVAGALAADRALRILDGDRDAFGAIVTFDGLTDRLRQVHVHPRESCALCGEQATIEDLDAGRYLGSDACAWLDGGQGD